MLELAELLDRSCTIGGAICSERWPLYRVAVEDPLSLGNRCHELDPDAVDGRSPGVCQLDCGAAAVRDPELGEDSPNLRHPSLELPAAAVPFAGRAAPVEPFMALDRPLAWLRLRCCCANGTRLTAAGWLWLKKCVLLKLVRAGEFTARLENRRLAAVGATGTCPLTRLADRRSAALTRMVLVNRPLAKSCALTAVTAPVTRAFR